MKRIKKKKKYLRLQKRTRKRESKRRKRSKQHLDIFGRAFSTNNNLGLIRHEESIIQSKSFPLDEFLNLNGNKFNSSIRKRIVVPKYFVLEKHHATSFDAITEIRKAIMQYRGETIYIDFSKCKEIDYSCIFLLLVILVEYYDYLSKIDKSLQVKRVRPEIMIVPAKDDDVNAKLMAGHLIPEAKITQSFLKPSSVLNFIKGQRSRKDYMENMKGPAATRIRNYINNSLKNHGLRLDEYNAGHMDGIISEVLNNAEDHSKFNTWYVSGNIFRSESSGSIEEDGVSEINLAFLNFGYSIFDGLEETKDCNREIYGQLMTMYENIKLKMTATHSFTKEEMFTLYALQEGISRLNYKTEDRGTGTMKILKSFIYLGDYVDSEKDIEPSFLIYSGNVFLKCDHKYRPVKIEGLDVLSLNKENDLRELPEKTHLKTLKNNFPGTLLVVKLYINKRHLQSKIKS